MALARRGSKSIEVGGIRYRWAVSQDSGYKVIVVQSDAGAGQKLEASTSYRNDSSQLAIRPSDVRAVIEAALAGGWAPDQRGAPPFVMRDVDRTVFGR
ncbi:MAG: hypothetical protein AAF467_25985 [Actinomycetota bacterium]